MSPQDTTPPEASPAACSIEVANLIEETRLHYKVSAFTTGGMDPEEGRAFRAAQSALQSAIRAHAERRVEDVVSGEAMVLDAGPNGITVEHPLFAIISRTLIEVLDGQDAKNYVETTMLDTSGVLPREFIVTVQRKDGQTPHQLRREAEERTASAVSEATAPLVDLLARALNHCWDSSGFHQGGVAYEFSIEVGKALATYTPSLDGGSDE